MGTKPLLVVENLSRDSINDVKDFDAEVHPAIDADIDPQLSQSGDRSESSDSCSENADETNLMNLYMDDVIEINDELIKIAMQIRSPYSRKPRYKLHPHGGGEHDDQDVYAKVLKSFRKKGIEQVLLSARRRMLSIDQAETSLVLRDCDEFLVHRLSQANDFRRQQFEYWRKYRSHSVRAATNAAVAADAGDSDRKLQPRALLVPPADVALVKSDQKASETMSMSVTLLAPNFELRNLRSARTYQSRALTEHAPGGDIIAWPEVPSSIPIGEVFECSLCFFICPREQRTGEPWRIHLKHDLCPYSRDQWIQHEQSSHMCLWRCPKDDTEFEDFPAYKIHVDTQHPAAADRIQLLSEGVLATTRSFAKQPSRSCPFCDVGLDSVGKMHDHIGGHLEAVALLAIPPLDDPDMQSQSDVVSSVAAGKDADGSRKNDFDETLSVTFPENNYSNEYYSAPHRISGADFDRHLARLPEEAVDQLFWITNVIPSEAGDPAPDPSGQSGTSYNADGTSLLLSGDDDTWDSMTQDLAPLTRASSIRSPTSLSSSMGARYLDDMPFLGPDQASNGYHANASEPRPLIKWGVWALSASLPNLQTLDLGMANFAGLQLITCHQIVSLPTPAMLTSLFPRSKVPYNRNLRRNKRKPIKDPEHLYAFYPSGKLSENLRHKHTSPRHPRFSPGQVELHLGPTDSTFHTCDSGFETEDLKYEANPSKVRAKLLSTHNNIFGLETVPLAENIG
ncbi:MAG: hypothetical protein Q9178_006595 [Gyalolechia marmorata]